MSGPAGPIAITGLGQVSLYVRDMDRAVAFYRDVIGLTHLFTIGGLGFLDAGGVRLYLHACEGDEWRPSSVLYFTVEDIGATFATLQAAGAKTAGDPHAIYTDDQTGVEEWMAFFEDTEGNMLAVMARLTSASVKPARETRVD